MFLKKITYVMAFIALILSGCANEQEDRAAGLLMPEPIDDQGWNYEAYQGVMSAQADRELEMFISEGKTSQADIKAKIDAWSEEGVELIIGHSHLYGDHFADLHEHYPDTHFVVMNEEVSGDNMTGLHFNGYAMGYFAGMLAADSSANEHIAAIGAFPFQPELQGFEDGARYYSSAVQTDIATIESWMDTEAAERKYDELTEAGADIFYPAGNGFNVQIIERVKEDQLHAIGYVGDQIDLGESVILSSTVQKVGYLYEYLLDAFQNDELTNGNHYFDFNDGAVAMGDFGAAVDEETKKWLNKHVSHYIEHEELPHESDVDEQLDSDS
ncbi:BMP family ABC transporter substrate-binding protein [Salisediminibacterium halotolerans]|uniref:Transcriptional activator of comK protein n=1 Tax=Salisediminibacterium halotolerans TaxID=517425 RepID=A0A1H9VER8_9BACI|nr:BMP family ABC transporter substrate-binding protein [Salisediminibacterium haloalkalitolerans]SES20059.1 transcriptional activator of comK gene [Salisediminibacterium haloalkalitolerans]